MERKVLANCLLTLNYINSKIYTGNYYTLKAICLHSTVDYFCLHPDFRTKPLKHKFMITVNALI